MNQNTKTWILTESAVCVALAVVLSQFTLFRMPLGGSVTPFSTLPLIIISLRHGSKWGIASALVYSLTQLFLGFSNILAVPVVNFGYMVLCALLDYVVAYTVIGLTGPIVHKFNNREIGISVGVLATGVLRLLCSFLSGIVVWGPFTPEGWNAAAYSIAYNGAWCGPDVVIVLVVCLILVRVPALGLFHKEKIAN